MMTSRMGSPLWTAPEVLKGEARDEKADTYSFGMLLYELLTRALPHGDVPAARVVMGVITNMLPRPTLPDDAAADAPPALVALMRACWQFDASERPSFSGILDELERIAAAAEISFD